MQDLIIRVNKKGTFMLIDAAVPGDRNVIEQETEKFLEYKDIIIEIQRMWNVKAIRWATGTISKSFRHYLSNTARNNEIKKFKKNIYLYIQPYWALHTNCGKC